MIMLKGVNKQIIEITDTGNLYIQKAILFVDPEKREYDNDFLIHQGKKYIKDMIRGITAVDTAAVNGDVTDLKFFT